MLCGSVTYSSLSSLMRQGSDASYVAPRKVKILFGVKGHYSQCFMSKFLLNCHLCAFIENKPIYYRYLDFSIKIIK